MPSLQVVTRTLGSEECAKAWFLEALMLHCLLLQTHPQLAINSNTISCHLINEESWKMPNVQTVSYQQVILLIQVARSTYSFEVVSINEGSALARYHLRAGLVPV